MDIEHNENYVEYLGRMIPESTFRAYVYSKDSKKLVNSWAEFQEAMASGVWFAEPVNKKVEEKATRRIKQKASD